MITGCISWVKALKDVMPDLRTAEFQALNAQDKADVHSMLVEAGYDLLPLATAKIDDAQLVNAA